MQLTKQKLYEMINGMLHQRKSLFVFDFDDTLAFTDSVVKVTRSGGTEALDSGAFANYTYQSGDELDFSDFDRVDGTLIPRPLQIMSNLLNDGKDVVIITARPPAAIDGIKQFLMQNNIKIPKIYATSGSSGKHAVLMKLLSTKMYNGVVLYEDSSANIQMLKNTVEEFEQQNNMQVRFDAILIDHDTTMRKIYEKINKTKTL